MDNARKQVMKGKRPKGPGNKLGAKHMGTPKPPKLISSTLDGPTLKPAPGPKLNG